MPARAALRKRSGPSARSVRYGGLAGRNRPKAGVACPTLRRLGRFDLACVDECNTFPSIARDRASIVRFQEQDRPLHLTEAAFRTDLRAPSMKDKCFSSQRSFSIHFQGNTV